MSFKNLFFFLLLLVLFSCSTVSSPEKRPLSAPSQKDLLFNSRPFPSPSESSAPSKKRERSDLPAEETLKSFITLERPEKNSPELLIGSSKKTTTDEKNYTLSLDLEGADLLDFLDALFLNTLGCNYVVDPRIRGKVTVHLKGTFSKESLVELTRHILELQDLALIQKNKVYYITSLNRKTRSSISYDILVYKPQYIMAQKLVTPIKPLLSQQATVLVETTTGTLLISDLSQNIKKALSILKILDKSFLENFCLEAYQPKVLSAKKLSEYLTKIFQSQILRSATPKNFIDFVAIEEVNLLLILARNESILERVSYWITQLDTGETLEKKVYVYPVENGDAEEIAQILQEAFSEDYKSQRNVVIKARKKKKTPSIIQGKVRILADKTNNLLVISATHDDYKTILNLLRQIDITPRQVLIEVIIAEVSLNKSLEYGVEWWIKTNFSINSRNYSGNISSVNNYGGVPGKGFSFVLFRNVEPRALLAALSQVSEVHILSNPVLLATDNKEARIQIGEEVPTVSQSVVNTSAQTPNITQNIQYRDVGIILKVKPHINSSGLVKLEVVQEISNVSDKTVQGVTSPVFTKRKVETSLVVQDGETVIIGGLIQNQQNNNESGVPLMKDIPFLGNFFRWQKKEKDRKELLIAITPRVVRNTEEAKKVMNSYRLRIERLKKQLLKEFKK